MSLCDGQSNTKDIAPDYTIAEQCHSFVYRCLEVQGDSLLESSVLMSVKCAQPNQAGEARI